MSRPRVSGVVLAVIVLTVSGLARAAPPVMIDSELGQELVGMNQSVDVTVNVTTRGVTVSHIDLPKGDGLTLMGTSQSEQSSFSMGPGGVDSSHTTSYHLNFRAQKPGDYTLSAVQVVAGNQHYQGKPLAVKVVPANQAPAQRAPQRQNNPFGSLFGGGFPQMPQAPGGMPRAPGLSSPGPDDDESDPFAQFFGNGRPPNGEDVILGAVVDKQRVVLGQQVTYTIRLYTRADVSEFSELKLPGFDGFWGEDLETPSRPVPHVQQLGGVPYEVYLIKKKALFPDRAGTLTIGPAEIDVSVGLGFFRGHKIHRESSAISLEVEPLPAGAPADFSPTNVGQWRFSASLLPASVPVGEPATLTLVADGRGNIHGLALPALPAIAGVRSYDPTSVDKSEPQGDRFGGRRQVDVILIPQRTGDFEVPPLTFAWYDPKVGYQQTTTPVMTLHAAVGAPGAGGTATAQGGQNVLESTYRGLRNPDTLATACAESARTLPGPRQGLELVLAFAVPPLLLLGAWTITLWRERRRRDAPALRGRQAYRIARARLRTEGASVTAAQMAQALYGYLEDRLGKPMSGLLQTELSARLAASGADAKAAGSALEALELAEALRYQPAGPAVNRELERLRSMAEFALEALERSNLKGARRSQKKEEAA